MGATKLNTVPVMLQPLPLALVLLLRLEQRRHFRCRGVDGHDRRCFRAASGDKQVADGRCGAEGQPRVISHHASQSVNDRAPLTAPKTSPCMSWRIWAILCWMSSISPEVLGFKIAMSVVSQVLGTRHAPASPSFIPRLNAISMTVVGNCRAKIRRTATCPDLLAPNATVVGPRQSNCRRILDYYCALCSRVLSGQEVISGRAPCNRGQPN